MSAAGIACMRGASRSRLALAAFSTNWRGVSGLLSYPTAAAAAAASPSSSGPFLYGNRRGQVLHISQFVEANGMRVDTLALVPSKHLVHKGTGGRSPVRTLAAGIACIRGGLRSRLAIAAFSTNRCGVNNLIFNPATADSPSSSGPFLYGNRQGQVLRISQFVKANGMHVDTLALVRRMEAQGLPLKHAEAIMLVITEVLNDKGGMLKGEMIRDANLSKLHSQVRRMEAQGLPLKHAEAIMLVITEVLNDKGGMQKGEMIRDANLSKLHSQEYLSSPLHMELEKVRGDIVEMRNAIKFKLDKASNGFKKSCIGIFSVCLMSALLVFVFVF